MQLTEQDWQIIRLVHRHRFLRSDQIILFMGSSRQQMLRRLNLLFHHGYLERPRAQLVYHEAGGTRTMVYGLGKKGGRLLSQKFGITVHAHTWSERNHVIGRVYLEHALFVTDVLLAIELACRKQGDVEMLYEDDLPIHSDKRPFQWQATVRTQTKIGVVPDRVFALDYTGLAGKRERTYFFLEADRGTMPVIRHSLSQTSFYRKMLAYAATWQQGIHERKLGISHFRVLTVTTSAKRVKTLIEACPTLRCGHGLFLFADKSILSGDVLSSAWQTSQPDKTARLLD